MTRRGVVLVTSFVLALVALLPATASAHGGQAPGAHDPNPLVGQSWWDQNTKWNPTWNGYRSLLRRGRTGDAAKVKLLAETPQFRWWGQWEQPVVGKLRGMFQQAGTNVPLLAIFGDRPHGCESAGEFATYRRWINKVVQGIGGNEVVIAYEPDSLGLATCGRKFAALRYGVKKLSKLPNATVYVEAGASDWMSPRKAAARLRSVGVKRVRGFMLNATHMTTNAANIKHGKKISKLLHGKHFIINTSHNGNGPMYSHGRTIWCNPPNAAAGTRPTTDTGNKLVDAYLWVERPGYSNGACNGGPAKVGAWWERRAIQMVERAKWYKNRH